MAHHIERSDFLELIRRNGDFDRRLPLRAFPAGFLRPLLPVGEHIPGRRRCRTGLVQEHGE